MSDTASKKTPFVDGTKLGECAPQQPLSGVPSVGSSSAYNGKSHGGYLHVKHTDGDKTTAA
jgi:hypothetical protein